MNTRLTVEDMATIRNIAEAIARFTIVSGRGMMEVTMQIAETILDKKELEAYRAVAIDCKEKLSNGENKVFSREKFLSDPNLLISKSMASRIDWPKQCDGMAVVDRECVGRDGTTYLMPDTWCVVVPDEKATPIEQIKERMKGLVEADAEGRIIILPPNVDEDYDGLKVKYRVFKARNNEPVEDCFVLRPEKDRAARMALRCYASYCANLQLAKDIDAWVTDIVKRKAVSIQDQQKGR